MQKKLILPGAAPSGAGPKKIVLTALAAPPNAPNSKGVVAVATVAADDSEDVMSRAVLLSPADARRWSQHFARAADVLDPVTRGGRDLTALAAALEEVGEDGETVLTRPDVPLAIAVSTAVEEPLVVLSVYEEGTDPREGVLVPMTADKARFVIAGLTRQIEAIEAREKPAEAPKGIVPRGRTIQ